MATWDDKHASMTGSTPGFWQLMPPTSFTQRSPYSESLVANTSRSEIHEMTTYNEQSRWSLQSSDGAPSIDEKTADAKLEEATSQPRKHSRKKSRALKKEAKEKELDAEKVQASLDPMKSLPAHEREILKRQLNINPVNVDFKTLYRYASKTDFLIMFIAALCSVIAGALLPLMTLIFGSLAQSFKDFFLDVISPSTFDSRLNHFVLYLLYLAAGEFIAVYVSTVGFIYTGEHITLKIRERYLAAILRQNIAFFDKLGAGEITTRITADTNLVQDGISEKIGLAITLVSTFITAFVIGFFKFWKLTLILTSTIFAITLVMGAGSSFIVKWNKQSLACYAAGGTVAEEVLSSIRNATAFNTQEKLARQYDAHLTEAEKWGFRHKALLGVLMGCMMCIVYLNYGLAFWQGARYYIEGEVNLSSVLTILMGIMIGAFSLGNVAPNVQAFNTAVAAATKIYTTIDRESPLDPTNRKDGNQIVPVLGNVELRRVKHIYPSRPEVVVMDNVSLLVPAGKTTALVGASGSGKSTIVGLVERFYDPVGGSVLLDGHDIRTLNLRWLRQQMALVSQEPTLFNVSIAENIKHGLIGTTYENLSESRRFDMVVAAAKMANAHDFIKQLPEGYDTNVGERAGLLSGGQKQRIAIARAVVSDPKILLLDEATSALDTKSEGVVQAALERAAQGRTTIVIAHRLSTIKSADNIVVMQEGRIIEQGTHNELLAKHGAYAGLVNAQSINTHVQDEVEEYEDWSDYENDDDLNGYSKRTTRQLKRLTTMTGFTYTEDPDDLTIRNKLKRQTSRQSASSVMLMNRAKEINRKYNLWSLLKVVANFNKEEWKFMLIGLLCSILAGGGNPTQSIFFSKTIVAMSVPPTEYDQLRSHVNFWCLMYLMLGGTQLLALGGQGVAFAYCSEKLVHRARDRSFRTMLRQDIGFFDKEENTSGSLTSFLSTETTFLAGLSGSTLGTILVVLTTLIASFSLSLAIGWKLALVCISAVPVLLAAGFFRFWILARFTARAKVAYEKSAGYACEATSAIRTVASLTREDDVWRQYNIQLMRQADRSLRSVLKTSILFAASQSFMFLCVALGFWYGGRLISSREYDLFQFFVCFSSVIFGAQSAGTIFSFAPDMSKARNAAMEMKKLFDRVPPIDSWSKAGTIANKVRGAVEFRDVHFRYPTRPEQPVLRGLNLKVRPGEYIALVGPSGCGKSTTIGLLERFYDPLTGSVLLDGQNINSFNINSYRSHLALVSQEPTLYQGTIRENILLGADTPADLVPESAIIRACKEANIYNFILSLPEGFNTVVGSKGSMLSGGQKQRVAIARALLRNPKVLLLDEATSALDSESEKVVQAALDNAAKGRTTIAVAHRLSTIQNADCIYVFDGGRIVESGTHKTLMAHRGKYAELVNLQTLERKA